MSSESRDTPMAVCAVWVTDSDVTPITGFGHGWLKAEVDYSTHSERIIIISYCIVDKMEALLLKY